MREISNYKLIKMISHVDYLTYSYPFNFFIGNDYYEVGLGQPSHNLDKYGMFIEHQYLMKNGKIIDFQDPDVMAYDEIVEMVERINPNGYPIYLIKKPNYMSGIQHLFIKKDFSSKILKQMRDTIKKVEEYNDINKD